MMSLSISIFSSLQIEPKNWKLNIVLFPFRHLFPSFLQFEFLKRSESLSQNDGIILAGIETHICVYQTERDLIRRGHHVEVVTNAVGSRDKNNHDIALDRIRNNGGFLTTVEMLLFNLQEKAGGERFKKLTKLIK